eukprot:2697496-Amphidinium_carterae.1
MGCGVTGGFSVRAVRNFQRLSTGRTLVDCLQNLLSRLESLLQLLTFIGPAALQQSQQPLSCEWLLHPSAVPLLQQCRQRVHPPRPNDSEQATKRIKQRGSSQLQCRPATCSKFYVADVATFH